MSYNELHTLNSRATPQMLMNYKHALMLHKIYNKNEPPQDWMSLNFEQALTSRQTYFLAIGTPNFKIGNNILSIRLKVLNNKIPLEWLNLSLNAYKIKCKELFL